MQITGILGWKSLSEVVIKLKNIGLIFAFFLVGSKVGEEAGKELGDLKGQIRLFFNKLQVVIKGLSVRKRSK